MQARIGEAVAVANTSPNRKNAYNYLKVLLSLAMQALRHAFFRSDAVSILLRDMKPYLKGESGYEEAVKEATQNLKIYVTE